MKSNVVNIANYREPDTQIIAKQILARELRRGQEEDEQARLNRLMDGIGIGIAFVVVFLLGAVTAAQIGLKMGW